MNIQSFDFSVDLLRAVLWQYDNAPALQSLLAQKSDWYEANQRAFWQDWYDQVFNLDTADEFGCAVWARILGIALSVDLPPSPLTKPTWGFGDFNDNFFNSNFSRTAEGVQTLTLEQKRLVLKLRYLQLVSRGTVPEINRALGDLFANEGTAYVIDGLDMSSSFVALGFSPSPGIRFILDTFDLLPRPAGVGLGYRNVQPAFGFGEFNENFFDSNFAGAF